MDPLRAALRITEQIPASEKYRAEFRFCWRALGLAALRLGDKEVFDRAVGAFGVEPESAELRLAALKSGHDRSTDYVRDFLGRFAEWYEVLWGAGLSELVPLLARIAGPQAMINQVRDLDDPFSRAHLYVRIARVVADPDLKVSTLQQARQSAELAQEGDYNYALGHVVSGFIDAGRLDLAEDTIGAMTNQQIRLDYIDRLRRAAQQAADTTRIRRAETAERDIRDSSPDIQSQSEVLLVAETLVGMDLDDDFPSSRTLFKRVGRLLRDGDQAGALSLVREHFPARVCPATLSLPDAELADLVLFQLQALESHKRNDLKVEYLTDLAVGLHERGLAVPEGASAALDDETFLWLAPPASVSVHAVDPTTLSFEAFVRHLLDRPIATTDEEKRILDRETFHDPRVADTEALVQMAAALFREFGSIGPRYSAGHVDQAMWFVIGFPYMVFSEAADVTEEAALELIRSTYHLFADYVAGRGLTDDVTSFHMVYDQLWRNDSWLPTIFETIVRVLEIDDDDCRAAALHGLNHLHDRREWRAAVERVIDEFLKRGGPNLAPGIVAYARECREGRAL